MKVRQEKAVNRVLNQVGSMEKEWRRSDRVGVSIYRNEKWDYHTFAEYNAICGSSSLIVMSDCFYESRNNE